MDLDEIKINNNLDSVNNFEDVKQLTIKTNGESKICPKQTDLCGCPLRCGEKVSKEARCYLFHQFQQLQSHNLQNKYLQKYIIIRSVAKRLWEDEIIDGKIQRRVTCKYQVPDLRNKDFTDKDLMKTENNVLDEKEPISENVHSPDHSDQQNVNEVDVPIQTDPNKPNDTANDYYNDTYDMSTDSSSSDSETDDFASIIAQNLTEDTKTASPITAGNIEICQKAFINIYSITEKRIRYLRERLIMKSRYLAEKKQKRIEEMERILSIAHDLGAGCQPLIALLEKTNSLHLSDQILAAIQKDVMLLNNFFRHQLWKPEYICENSALESNNKVDAAQTSLLQRLEPTQKSS